MGRLESRVKAIAREVGFADVGITDIRPSEHASYYLGWLAAGRHGEMRYLQRSDAVRRRLRPDLELAELRSAVVVADDYGAAPATSGDPGSDPSCAVIARYARGRDYHRVMKKKLLRLLHAIEGEVGRELSAARAYVDTGPVLERELARRAGLGWFGRNTMLIHPRRGSYFFLGSLLLELDLEPDTPFEREHCGTCNACMEACPTGALLGRDQNGAPVIDATRCISYLTIEHRGPIPVEMRAAIGNRVFGCDICQEVCPWNSPKILELARERAAAAGVPPGRDYRPDWREAADWPDAPDDLPGTESPSLVELLRMTRDQWDRWTRGATIRRAGYNGFRRNVAVAIGNGLASVDEPPEEAVAVLQQALEDGSKLVREHAAWALGRAGV